MDVFLIVLIIKLLAITISIYELIQFITTHL